MGQIRLQVLPLVFMRLELISDLLSERGKDLPEGLTLCLHRPELPEQKVLTRNEACRKVLLRPQLSRQQLHLFLQSLHLLLKTLDLLPSLLVLILG